jgi:hypothetical protein
VSTRKACKGMPSRIASPRTSCLRFPGDKYEGLLCRPLNRRRPSKHRVVPPEISSLTGDEWRLMEQLMRPAVWLPASGARI